MMSNRAYLLSTKATGLGPLTRSCRTRLRGQLCAGCGIRLAGTDLDLEVEVSRPDIIMQALQLANESTTSGGVDGIDVPLNFVRGVRAHVLRSDLLDILRPKCRSQFLYGSVTVSGYGEMSGFLASQDPMEVAVRGSKCPSISVCGTCGHLSAFAAGQLYLLGPNLEDDEVREASRGSYVSQVDFGVQLASLPEDARATLSVDALPVLTDPLDGLPRELPTTWEEYESLMGPAADFPKQVWTANPRHVIGPWAARRIAERGMGSYFKRPDIRDLAIKLAVDGEEVRQTLEQWPEVRDEVLRYYDQHRSELEAIAEWRPD